MNNTTELTDHLLSTAAPHLRPAISKTQLFTNSFYLCIGFVIIILNGAIAATVFLRRELRKRPEMAIFATLVTADLICGIAYFTAGIQRLYILLNRVPKTTAMMCMLRVYNLGFLIGPQLLTLMMLITSIDRLICIISFRFYRNLDRAYFYAIVGIPILLVIASTTTAIVLAATWMPGGEIINPVCVTNASVPDAYYMFYSMIRLFGSMLSVLLYVIVMVFFIVKKDYSESKTIQDIQQRRQIQITKLLAIQSGCTFFIYAIPTALITYFAYGYTGPATSASTLITVCGCFTGSYSALSTFAYLLRPSEVRSHLVAMLKKTLLTRFQSSTTEGELQSVFTFHRSFGTSSYRDVPTPELTSTPERTLGQGSRNSSAASGLRMTADTPKSARQIAEEAFATKTPEKSDNAQSPAIRFDFNTKFGPSSPNSKPDELTSAPNPGSRPPNSKPGSSPSKPKPGISPLNPKPVYSPLNSKPGSSPLNHKPGSSPQSSKSGLSPSNPKPKSCPPNSQLGTSQPNPTSDRLSVSTASSFTPSSSSNSEQDEFGSIPELKDSTPSPVKPFWPKVTPEIKLGATPPLARGEEMKPPTAYSCNARSNGHLKTPTPVITSAGKSISPGAFAESGKFDFVDKTPTPCSDTLL